MDHPGNPSTAANHDVPLPESVSEPSQGYGKRPTLNRPMVTDPEVDVALKKFGSCAFAHFFEQLVATPYSAEQGCK